MSKLPLKVKTRRAKWKPLDDSKAAKEIGLFQADIQVASKMYVYPKSLENNKLYHWWRRRKISKQLKKEYDRIQQRRSNQ